MSESSKSLPLRAIGVFIIFACFIGLIAVHHPNDNADLKPSAYIVAVMLIGFACLIFGESQDGRQIISIGRSRKDKDKK